MIAPSSGVRKGGKERGEVWNNLRGVEGECDYVGMVQHVAPHVCRRG